MRWLFGGVFCFAGLAMMIYGIVTWFTARDSESWPSVEGTMTVSEVESHTSSGGRNQPSRTTYRPRVAYEYVVDGRTYAGQHFEFVEHGDSDSGVIERRLRGFEVGRTVPVFYDPENPARSVLQVGVPSALWLMVAMGFGFAIIGACVPWFLGARQSKPYRRSFGRKRWIRSDAGGS